MNYEIIEYELLQSKIIKRTDDDGTEHFIPFDENNIDYQQYLEDTKSEG